MECNKDEAIRAKEIAEKNMQSKEFEAARRMLHRAQQLYSELENVSQMLMVCDVHCAAAEVKLRNSKEILIDWYGILQIEQTADEATIKKQYRKFALQLHPDKNKFPGAEAAFKLIGEAQRVLLDQAKRSAFDMKRRIGGPVCVPAQKQSFFPHGVGRRTANFTGVNLQQQPRQWPTHQGFSNGRSIFWTKCPYCAVKYQYYTDFLHRSLRCQQCTKTFIAYDSSAATEPTKLNKPKFSQQRDSQNQGACKVQEGSQGNSGFQNSKMLYPPKGSGSSEVGAKKVTGRRGRQIYVDSSGSIDSESSRDTKEGMVVDRNGDIFSGTNCKPPGEQNLWRSGRRKQEVSYKENLSDDDDLSSPSKKAKMSGSSCTTGATGVKIEKQSYLASVAKDGQKKEHRKGACNETGVLCHEKETVRGFGERMAEENDLKKSFEACTGAAKGIPKTDATEMDSVHESMTDTKIYLCPDTEFHDFEKDKKEECFAAGQIWAIYDTLDAMPRFYARIRKIFYPGFKLMITWLEPDPDDEDETEWVNEGLPVSCGKFINGQTENTENSLMFSHLMCWEQGKVIDSYRVLPRKGETWALFKNWDINWKSDAFANLKYEYEFVEIVSEYAEGVGTHVAHLAKLKGFVSVFCRVVKEGMDVFQIPPCELFRFSHRVPSYKLTGEEHEGVPKGSFELDPASLPTKLEEISLPEGLKVELCNDHVSYSSSSKKQVPLTEPVDSAPMNRRKAVVDLDDGSSDCGTVGDGCSAASTSEAAEIPEAEFYDFVNEKSEEKFQVGQVWALYGNEDRLPKYYVEIRKLESGPVFKLHVRWLDPCFTSNMIKWHDDKMPTSCGRFKIRKGVSEVYTSTHLFSHRLKVVAASKKDEYTVFPHEGEVWALYENWTPGMRSSELEKCKYDIVEVIMVTDLYVEVLALERISSFNSVFKSQVKNGSNVMKKIPQTEMVRFSHRIPSFQLTNERGGSLRGFLELDPAAVPR